MKAHPNDPNVSIYGIDALINITTNNGKYQLQIEDKLKILNFIKQQSHSR